MQKKELIGSLFGVVLLLFLLSACATTDSTTDTIGNTTDATSNFTSSTSPGGSSDSAKVEQFIRNNYARVKSDMARGGGEYLETLAVLLRIPSDQRERFYHMTQTKFASLYPVPDTTPRAMMAVLDQEISILSES